MGSYSPRHIPSTWKRFFASEYDFYLAVLTSCLRFCDQNCQCQEKAPSVYCFLGNVYTFVYTDGWRSEDYIYGGVGVRPLCLVHTLSSPHAVRNSTVDVLNCYSPCANTAPAAAFAHFSDWIGHRRSLLGGLFDLGAVCYRHTNIYTKSRHARTITRKTSIY